MSGALFKGGVLMIRWLRAGRSLLVKLGVGARGEPGPASGYEQSSGSMAGAGGAGLDDDDDGGADANVLSGGLLGGWA